MQLVMLLQNRLECATWSFPKKENCWLSGDIVLEHEPEKLTKNYSQSLMQSSVYDTTLLLSIECLCSRAIYFVPIVGGGVIDQLPFKC